jgi:hypothetical protein
MAYYFLPIEFLDPFSCDFGDCFSFNPFGEVIHAYYKKLQLSWSQRKRTNDVYCPFVERPWRVN